MVSFVCNACGQTVKKQKVEKHYQTECRSCEVLSCIDCGKDFPGDSYAQHTSCISEAEKYQGKLYKPKDKANKGERKQQEWIEKVRNSSSDMEKQDPRIRKIMARITACDNVPRKEKKFKKFCENSINVRDPDLRDKLWEVFSGVKNSGAKSDEVETSVPKTDDIQATGENGATETDNKSKEENTVVDESVTETVDVVDNVDGNDNDEKRKSRSKKTEGENEISTSCEHLNGKKDKKSKKKKVDKSQEGDREGVACNGKDHNMEAVNGLHSLEHSKIAAGKKVKAKKNKKRKNEGVDEETDVREKKVKVIEDNSIVDQHEDNNVDNQETETHQGKFRWEAVIKKLLKAAPDNEMSVKKLRKKVLNEYAACGQDARSRTKEELLVLFEKKLHKNPKVKVLKERAKYCK